MRDVLPISRDDELIDGRRQLHLDARLRAVVGVHAGQPHRRRARMIAGAVAEGVGLQMRQAAEDVDLVAHAGERLQHRRQLEAGAGRRRRPLVLDDAVGDVDEAEARRGLERARRERRHHRVEERQRDVAPIARRNVRRGSAFFVTNITRLPASRIWNGRLLTTPSTSDASV